jgi:hypothetical protein
MTMKLELVKAEEGDCLLLHYGKADAPALSLVDGGPPGVYAKHLEPRLEQLRGDLAPDGGPLPLELVMVSHIDSDHIGGVLNLLRAIEIARNDKADEPYAIGRLWHNSFKQLTKASDESAEAAANLPMEEMPKAAAVVASFGQGEDTSAVAAELGIPRNEQSEEGSLVLDGASRTLPGGLKLTVIGPTAEEVENLREKWAASMHVKAAELVPAAVQETVYNLSSLIVVAEFEGRRILLTGDGVADDILAGLKRHGFLDDGPAHFDILKLPHHGDDGNVNEKLFKEVVADHYVGSGNGKNGNPELETLQMLAAARGDDKYDIWLTYRNGKEDLDENLATFEREQKEAKRNSTIHYPEDDALSMTVELD